MSTPYIFPGLWEIIGVNKLWVIGTIVLLTQHLIGCIHWAAPQFPAQLHQPGSCCVSGVTTHSPQLLALTCSLGPCQPTLLQTYEGHSLGDGTGQGLYPVGAEGGFILLWIKEERGLRHTAPLDFRTWDRILVHFILSTRPCVHGLSRKLGINFSKFTR